MVKLSELRDSDSVISSCLCVWSKQVIRKGEVSCCWICTPCKDNEIVQDEFTCRTCELGWWPDPELEGTAILSSISTELWLNGNKRKGAKQCHHAVVFVRRVCCYIYTQLMRAKIHLVTVHQRILCHILSSTIVYILCIITWHYSRPTAYCLFAVNI